MLVDFRETISDLLLDTFTTRWREWARQHGGIVRNQAHGSPASLLDLYAASDIPETEGNEAMRLRWASSAAHVAGRRLASAEAATWLNEHFRSTLYFVSNQSAKPLDGWVRLATSEPIATLFDPMSGRHGAAMVRRGAGGLEVRLQIGPGESLVVSTHSRSRGGNGVEYFTDAGPARDITGAWALQFVAGGPELPAAVSLDRLASWTTLGGEALRRFSGTGRYTLRLARPADTAPAWRLDLGDVRESARVRLNGHELATLIGPRFSVVVRDAMLRADNELVVEVTNLMANRIADLDRRGVHWKKFYNVNFPSRLPENRGPDGLFTAAKWDPLDSGLLGPVTLTALR